MKNNLLNKFNYELPKKINLENDSVLLSPLKIDDLDSLFEAAQEDSENIFYHMFFGPFLSKLDLQKWIYQEINSTSHITFSVYSKRLRAFVGTCSIINTDLIHVSSEIGSIWYSKLARGSEVNTSVVLLLLSYFFETLNYRRIVWKCDNTNEVSKATALKLGFKFEGIFKKHLVIKDRSRDTVWYAIIDDEWKQIKEVLNIRLSKKIISFKKPNSFQI